MECGGRFALRTNFSLDLARSVIYSFVFGPSIFGLRGGVGHLRAWGKMMRRFVGLLSCLLVLVNAHGAIAAEFYSYPYGIYMVGEITAGDYDRFVSVLKTRGAQPFILFLRSGGGNVPEAMKIGRLVRRLSGSVQAPGGSAQEFNRASCADEEKLIGKAIPCICASACTLIFFAGIFRVGLEIYIHSIAFEKNMFGSLSPADAARAYKETMQQIKTYLSDMDVSDKYYYMMTQTASSGLVRVPLAGEKDFNGFTPAFREWIIAKCGVPASQSCAGKAGGEAQTDAIRQFLSE